MEFNFKKGDIIEFCGDEFVVIENYGDSGKVKENSKQGCTINPFYWKYSGETCKLKTV